MKSFLFFVEEERALPKIPVFFCINAHCDGEHDNYTCLQIRSGKFQVTEQYP